MSESNNREPCVGEGVCRQYLQMTANAGKLRRTTFVKQFLHHGICLGGVKAKPTACWLRSEMPEVSQKP